MRAAKLASSKEARLLCVVKVSARWFKTPSRKTCTGTANRAQPPAASPAYMAVHACRRVAHRSPPLPVLLGTLTLEAELGKAALCLGYARATSGLANGITSGTDHLLQCDSALPRLLTVHKSPVGPQDCRAKSTGIKNLYFIGRPPWQVSNATIGFLGGPKLTMKTPSKSPRQGSDQITCLGRLCRQILRLRHHC